MQKTPKLSPLKREGRCHRSSFKHRSEDRRQRRVKPPCQTLSTDLIASSRRAQDLLGTTRPSQLPRVPRTYQVQSPCPPQWLWSLFQGMWQVSPSFLTSTQTSTTHELAVMLMLPNPFKVVAITRSNEHVSHWPPSAYRTAPAVFRSSLSLILPSGLTLTSHHRLRHLTQAGVTATLSLC